MQRLDEYFTNLRSIEVNLARPAVSCKTPAPVTRDFSAAYGGPEPLVARSDAMWDLLAMAFACDLTRVASVQLTSAMPQTIFYQLGISLPLHGLTHQPVSPTMLQQVHSTIVYTQSQLARLLARLRAQSEGTGNILDNTVGYFTSDLQDALLHSHADYPLLVAGRAGGYLKYPGVHYRSATQENTSNVMLTVLRAAGVKVDSFGHGASFTRERCTAIEAET